MILPRKRRSNPLTTVLWVNAALLAVIAILLFSRSGAPSLVQSAYGQNQPAIAGGAGVFIMPGQIQEHVWGCYLLDVDAKTLCAYQYTAGDRQLRLAAARSYRYDTKLENFNTEKPTPREVQKLLEKQAAGIAAGPGNGEKDKDHDKDK